MRVHKYENLPEDSEFGHEKYRAALTESLMLQDEDEVSVQGKRRGDLYPMLEHIEVTL